MKKPEEYLDPFPKLHCDNQTVVTKADAELAVEAALADAERYRNLLMRALRRVYVASMPPPPPLTTPHV